MTAALIFAVILLLLFSVFFSVKRGIIDGYNNVLIIVCLLYTSDAADD